MKTLADWYPGDRIAFPCLEMLGMIVIIVAAAFAAGQLLGRRRAALRSGLWQAALLAVVATPALAFWGSRLPWHVAIFSSEKAVADTAAAADSQPLPVPASPAGASGEVDSPPYGGLELPHEEVPSTSRAVPEVVPAEVQHDESAPRSPPTFAAKATAIVEQPAAPPPNLFQALATAGLFVWGLGSIFLIARTVHGYRTVRRLRRRLRPLDGEHWAAELRAAASTLSVASLPDICLSPDVRGPAVLGVLAPRVVLPESLLEHCTAPKLREILVHECAHIVRRDPWVRLFQSLAAVLFWMHPLVVLLNRRLSQAREEVCDNFVLTQGEPVEYAETLLTVARMCYPYPRPEGFLTMIPNQQSLEHRVADLLAENRDRSTRLSGSHRIALSSALAVVLVSMASFGMHGHAQTAKADVTLPTPGSALLLDHLSPKEMNQPAAGEKVTGAVYAADGSPAAGAVVWAALLNHAVLVRQETSADAEGRFTLRLPPGTWCLWARRGTQGGNGGGSKESFEVVAGRAVQPETIRLEERGTLRGRLLEAETGKPIAGGQLFLDEGLVLTTGADGRFELGGLSRKDHELFVVAPGRRRIRVLFDTTGRANTELEVPVVRGGKVVGRVTDEEGKPIPGAYVGNETSAHYFSYSGLFSACDSQGRFEYDGVSPDVPFWLSAFAPGFAQEERQGLVIPAEGKPLEVHFHLRPKLATAKDAAAGKGKKSRVIVGIIRGPDKKPVEGVLVRWGLMNLNSSIQTKTDIRGQYGLTVPDEPEFLAVLPRDFRPQFPANHLRWQPNRQFRFAGRGYSSRPGA